MKFLGPIPKWDFYNSIQVRWIGIHVAEDGGLAVAIFIYAYIQAALRENSMALMIKVNKNIELQNLERKCLLISLSAGTNCLR